MKFRIKTENTEPLTLEANTAWDALKLAVNGHLLRSPGIEGDMQVERDGTIWASIWRTGKLYYIRPLRPARCVCGDLMANHPTAVCQQHNFEKTNVPPPEDQSEERNRSASGGRQNSE